MMKTTNDFVLEQISMRPEVTLEDLRARAAMEGRRVRTATFYRARADLGLDGRLAAVAEPQEQEAAPAQPLALETDAATGPDSTPESNTKPARISKRVSLDRTAILLAQAVGEFVAERDRLRDALMRMRAIVREILLR